MGQLDIKSKTVLLARRDASADEAAPGRVGGEEHGEARRANTIWNGGLHLELGRLRLKPGVNLTSRLLRRHCQYIYVYRIIDLVQVY